MDPYDYICSKEDSHFISDLQGKMTREKLKSYFKEIGINTRTVEYWNKLLKYFCEDAVEFDSIEEINKWCES